MANTIDFISSVADFLMEDCPDAYPSKDIAIEEIDDIMQILRRDFYSPEEVFPFERYMITRFYDAQHGIEEFCFNVRYAVLETFDGELAKSYSLSEEIKTLPHFSEMFDDDDD